MKITEELLIKDGFVLTEEPAFENIKLPYYVRNCVVLFFTSSPPENTYLIGYGFSVRDKYFAATFRWIHTMEDLITIYEAVTSKNYR